MFPFVGHSGLALYTKGGRARISGANVTNRKTNVPTCCGCGGAALYVAHKDFAQNIATVVPGRHHPALYTDCCAIPLLSTGGRGRGPDMAGALSSNDDYFHFFSAHRPAKPLRLQCKAGYNQPCLTQCSVTVVHGAALYSLNAYRRGDITSVVGAHESCAWLHVQFARPLHAVSPHQILVLYTTEDSNISTFDVCIGGGKIAMVGKSCADNYEWLGHAIMPRKRVCPSS